MRPRAASATSPANEKGTMKGSVTQAGRVSVADQCRRLAEMLSCDAGGVMSIASGQRRVAWWAAPDSPPLPARLDDVLEGRTDGWVELLRFEKMNGEH